MGFQLNTSVLNQKGSPAIYTDTFANRPPFGYAGRLFISNDTAAIYEDTGTAWVLIANVSSGAGTLQQVTTNGNTSNVGISVTAGGVSTNSATITSLTQGSVPFVGAAGLITQDNANLFFDDTNNRLGINTNTPGNSLDVHSAGTNPILALNNTAGNQSAISFLNSSVQKWRVGNSATNSFDIFNPTNSTIAISIDSGSTLKFITSPKIANNTGLSPEAGFGAIGFLTSGVIFQRDNSANKLFFDFSGFTAQRTFICPNVDGTLALTTDLGAYLPLTGGNLTGPLKIKGILTIERSTNTQYSTIDNEGGNFNFDANSGYNIIFKLAAINKMILFNSTGNLGINTPVDDTVNKLQVTGNGKFTERLTLGDTVGNTPLTWARSGGATGYLYSDGDNVGFSNVLDFGAGAEGILLESSSSSMNFYTNQIIRLNINSSGVLKVSNLAGTGSRAVIADATGILSAPVSDISVKENIEPLKYGLETIMQLNAVQFEFIEGYKNYGEGLQIGAIAQEVEQIIPEAVFKTPSTGLMGINYNQFDGIYIKAIQDLNNIIEGLLKRIELLENK